MRRVFLTIGPRGAGKSTFCRRIKERRDDVTLLERDAILIELFGGTMLNPYIGGHEHGAWVLFERLGRALAPEDALVILDTWSNSPDVRKSLICDLRSPGYAVDEVIGWYFTTPAETAFLQFCAREGAHAIQSWGTRIEEHYLRDYRCMHAQPPCTYEGFDAVIPIDPTQTWLFSPDLFLLPPPHT